MGYSDGRNNEVKWFHASNETIDSQFSAGTIAKSKCVFFTIFEQSDRRHGLAHAKIGT